MLIKRIVKSGLRRLGYDLVRVYESSPQDTWFVFDESCQIPFLSSIYSQVFGQDIPGALVEVGAFDGISYSNSSGLLEKGWRGILVEPMPSFAEKCRERYRNNPKVRVVENAISNNSGTLLLEIAGPLSTLSHELFEEYRSLEWSKPSVTNASVNVQTLTLDKLLENEGVSQNFELLIVDVEGFETQVFEGFDILHWKPKMIIVELSDFHPNLETHRQSHFFLGEELLNAGYTVIYKDGINTIFVETKILDNLFSRNF